MIRAAGGSPVHAAFLRAVNVAGHAVVRMEDLRRAFEEAGCREVRTVIQSGNVLFAAPERGLDALKGRIRHNLEMLLGSTPVAIYRTADELRILAASDPFGGAEAGPDVKLYVALLAEPPKKHPVLPLVVAKEGLEVVGFVGLDAFIVSRRVKGRFGFPNLLVEKALGVEATTRNWNTVLKIAKLVAGGRP